MVEKAAGGTAALPVFRYHPDSLATGAVVASVARCHSCGRERGYIYDGPILAAEDCDDSFCPWCIANGSVSEKFGAVFTDTTIGVPDDIPDTILREISQRTPGFFAWQEERWLFHCEEGAAFLGCMGWSDLEAIPAAMAAIRREALDSGWSSGSADEYLNSLRKDHSPSAYLFKCLHCGTFLAYSDFT